MYTLLLYCTLGICIAAPLAAYAKYRDVFHPLMVVPPMCAFIYVYMPYKFVRSGELDAYLTGQQCLFIQSVVLLALAAWFHGCWTGSEAILPPPKRKNMPVDSAVLHKGAYILGSFGLLCWYATVRAVGGFTRAFGVAYGNGWSPIGYIRESVYLLIVAVLLLLTPEGYRFPQKKWLIAVILFSIPWLMQGLLGARRGPTFVITVAIGMSWFIARGTRPSPVLMLSGGVALGLLMLFLVTNRSSIYLGSDFNNISTDVTKDVTAANEANEYIFGGGVMVAARATGHYYWGRRYLAEFIVRPIPRQIWPNKYADFGVPELEQNAGVAGEGIKSETNWEEVPGAAAAMVADFWVEFSWLCIPFCWLVGWCYGYVWKRAVQEGRFWNTQYVILALLSIYLVTQSGEAVIFRLVLLSVPCAWIWHKAIANGERAAQPAPQPAPQRAAALT